MRKMIMLAIASFLWKQFQKRTTRSSLNRVPTKR